LQLRPCELIERNAEKLKALVLEQIAIWKLPDAFRAWVANDCLWLCNLVDCIVTDGPTDHPLAANDKLLACAEPYALWAIEIPKGREVSLFAQSANAQRSSQRDGG
jgi:tagaturonate reductase